jgi:hypothetical protein
MNEIELTARREGGVNDTNDIHRIIDYMKKLKDKLHKVWIKNHNIKITLVSIKLFIISNLVYAILIFVITRLFILKK